MTSTVSAERLDIATPTGYLSVDGDDQATLFVRASLHSRDAVSEAVDAIARLNSDIVGSYNGFRHEEDGIRLEWNITGRLVPFRRATAAWRDDPASYLPAALGLARFAFRASGDLEALRPGRYLLSPAQVFLLHAENSSPRWIALPVPLEGATFTDFVTADRECLAWLSADEMLGRVRSDRPYLIGAAMYDSLVGRLFPGDLSRRETIRRLLQYRAGHEARTQATLAQAVPPALSVRAAELARFVHALLDAPFGSAFTASIVNTELARFEDDLSAARLAAAWEHAAASARAVRVLNVFAETAAVDDVPWEMLARLRRVTGDRAGAEAAEARIEAEREDRSATVIRAVRGMASDLPARQHELEDAVSVLWSAPSTAVGSPGAAKPVVSVADEEYLYLAYANARWLSRGQRSIELLRREFAVSWHALARTLLTARILADVSNWEETARHCRDARRQVDRLPNGGGDRGRRLRAYIDLLDAISHIRAVERGHSKDYFMEAFQYLAHAAVPDETPTDGTFAADVARWAAYLAGRTRLDPALAGLRLGVEAFCHAIGATVDISESVANPPVPWPPEEDLFTA